MSDRSRRPPFVELSAPDDAPGDGPLVYRRRLVSPTLSVALVVAAVVGLVGVGLGYRLGQADRSAPPPATPTPTLLADATAAASLDIQADTVSQRLEVAYREIPLGSWAICQLGRAVLCRTLEPSLSVSPAVHYTSGFTNSDMAQFGQPAIDPGHLVLAAGLGEGVVTASLIALDAPGSRARQALTPIDPGRSGVDYFDLGSLPGGTYGIVVGFIPQTGGDNSPPLLDSYLASFAVTG
jgi:hypothetical protein